MYLKVEVAACDSSIIDIESPSGYGQPGDGQWVRRPPVVRREQGVDLRADRLAPWVMDLRAVVDGVEGPPNGIVTGTDPAAGLQVDRGASIVLVTQRRGSGASD